MCVGIRVCVFRFLTENSGMQILNRSFYVTFLFVFLMDLVVLDGSCCQLLQMQAKNFF